MPSKSSRRITDRLLADNPGLTVGVPASGSHQKIKLNGRLVGIIPMRLRAEGLSPNLVAQLRRSGVVVPRRMG